MDLKERIESFAEFGDTLRKILAGKSSVYYGEMNDVIENQVYINPWFTSENVRTALEAISSEITIENLQKWTGIYPELNEKKYPLKVGVIMAGNIPLAGFHDFLSVLISGNNLIAKPSSKDPVLIKYLSKILCSVNEQFKNRIEITDGVLTNFDLVIATGSNNSSRYFEQYFGKYPNIIRKNRNSIAVIDGTETTGELEDLGTDIFTYFGLGCRNVSKVYLPKGYKPADLASKWEKYSTIVKHVKYANNYDFNKAVFLVNRDKFFDSGHLLLKEEVKIASPVSVLHYEYYNSQAEVKTQLERSKDNIQCFVGRDYVPFGKSQWPHLWDYADGIDTIEFLLKKNLAGIL